MEPSAYHVAARPASRRGLGLSGLFTVLSAAVLFGVLGYMYVSVKARQHDLARDFADTEARMEDLRTEISVLQREKGELLSVAHLERRLREAGSELQPIHPSRVISLRAPEFHVGAPDAATRNRMEYLAGVSRSGEEGLADE